MATDGPTPAPCDRNVFNSGTVMFITNTIPSNAMERWVKRVARLSGQSVDWHFAGGRAVVLALGDLEVVKAALFEAMEEHNSLFRKEWRATGLSWPPDDYIPRFGENRETIDPAAFDKLNRG